MAKLTEQQIEDALRKLPEWADAKGKIQRTFQFKDFVGAMGFVNQVADLAEARQHHPDILIRYNKVTLTLTTHDAGGISEKDFEYASATDAMA